MMSAQRSARPTSRVTPQPALIQQSKASAGTRKPAVGHCMRAILTRRGRSDTKGLWRESPCWLDLVASHQAGVDIKTNTELLFHQSIRYRFIYICLCTRCDVLPTSLDISRALETGRISS